MKKVSRATQKQALERECTKPTTNAASPPERLRERFLSPYREMEAERRMEMKILVYIPCNSAAFSIAFKSKKGRGL